MAAGIKGRKVSVSGSSIVFQFTGKDGAEERLQHTISIRLLKALPLHFILRTSTLQLTF